VICGPLCSVYSVIGSVFMHNTRQASKCVSW
jgi:hypothetical protein